MRYIGKDKEETIIIIIRFVIDHSHCDIIDCIFRNQMIIVVLMSYCYVRVLVFWPDLFSLHFDDTNKLTF